MFRFFWIFCALLIHLQAGECRICKFVEGEKAVFSDFLVPFSTGIELSKIHHDLELEAEKHFIALSRHSLGEGYHVNFSSETAIGYIEFQTAEGVKASIRFDKTCRPITPLLQRCEDQKIVEKFRIIIFQMLLSKD